MVEEIKDEGPVPEKPKSFLQRLWEGLVPPPPPPTPNEIKKFRKVQQFKKAKRKTQKASRKVNRRK